MRTAITTLHKTFRRLAALAVAAVIVLSGVPAAAQPSLPLLVFGSQGTGFGQFERPGRLAVDSAGNTYVIDTGNSRVEVFDSMGVPLFAFGSAGSQPGQFDQPTDIAVAADGSIYVADSGSFRVQRFGSTGVFEGSFGSEGRDPGQFFNQIMSLALDSDGNVYVGSVFQLQKFSPDGELLKVYELGGILPKALAIAANGDIVMHERDNGTINVYDNEGVFIRQFSRTGCNIEAGFGCTTTQPGAIEPGDGELQLDAAVAVDADGNIYVADSGNHRIQKFSPNGIFLWKFGGPGSNDGQFGQDIGPQGLAVDASGRLYVADTDNHRVQVFEDEEGRTITIADQAVVEGNAGVVEAVFTVSLSSSSTSVVSVEFTTVDGSAEAGTDYRSASGTLTFAPGQTTATITVLVEGDTTLETDESFSIQLSNPVGASLGDDQAIGTIVDDDNDGGSGDDTTPPVVTYEIDPPPNAAGWNNTPVTLTWTVSDDESGIESTSGCQTRQLETDGEFTFTCTVVNGDGLSTSVTATVRIDRTPPVVTCQTPNNLWNAADVSITCTATDSGSGVASPGSTFVLSTSVPAGTETDAAVTGSMTVTDRAGNSIQAGPIGPIKVDKKAPTISIVSPTARNFILNEPMTAQYSCSDGGAQVASCVGPVANGSAMKPGIGSHVFLVNAVDRVGNKASASVTYTVSYDVCLLYNPSTSLRIGPIAPILLTLCDANRQNVSSPNVTLKAIALVNVDTGAVLRPRSPLPPGDTFVYLPVPVPGSYLFPLMTVGVPPGRYELRFRAGADPTVHVAPLRLR